MLKFNNKITLLALFVALSTFAPAMAAETISPADEVTVISQPHPTFGMRHPRLARLGHGLKATGKKAGKFIKTIGPYLGFGVDVAALVVLFL